MEANMITESKIVEILNTNALAVERAIIVIYDRQTQDEKADGTTKHSNNIGFSGTTDKRGTYYARWILSGRRLTGHHLDKARKIAIHHRKQLLDVAQKKATAKASVAPKATGCIGCGQEGTCVFGWCNHHKCPV